MLSPVTLGTVKLTIKPNQDSYQAIKSVEAASYRAREVEEGGRLPGGSTGTPESL